MGIGGANLLRRDLLHESLDKPGDHLGGLRIAVQVIDAQLVAVPLSYPVPAQPKK
jgi:hypothetical protein